MATEAMIVPEVLPPRGRPRASRYSCPYMGAGGVSCPKTCPRMGSCPSLAQGIVAGGYTYVDPTSGVVTTISEPGATAGWQQELELFLEETSPFFGLPWKWVFIGGVLAYALFRKR